MPEDNFADISGGLCGTPRKVQADDGCGVSIYRYTNAAAQGLTFAGANNEYYVAYQEGIYVGYRYHETRCEDAVMGAGNAGDYDYASTVANSNAMNGVSANMQVIEIRPWWKNAIVAADVVFGVLAAGSILMLVRTIKKNKKSNISVYPLILSPNSLLCSR